MFRNYVILLLLSITTFSCSYFKANKIEENTAIAKVNDVYLYKKDIVNSLPDNFKKSDSALLASNFIKNWVKDQILLNKAKINLKEESEEINELVEK
ncbi:MAG: peptidyl-prolyl cis-trans isomerase, partial [Flavobacteriaceae bacterium]